MLASGLALVLILTGSAPASAQDGTHAMQAQFSVHVLGVRIGLFGVTGSTTATRYTASAAYASTGLSRQFRDLRFTMRSTGRRTEGRFQPIDYAETVDLGDTQAEAGLGYTGGIPAFRGTKIGADDAPPLSPQAQRDTVDPMTATFMALRDRPRAGLCDLRQVIFDGARRTRLSLRPGDGNGTGIGDSVTCLGRFERLGGYTDQELAKARSFDLSLQFATGPDGLMRVERIAFQSTLGPVALIRR